MSYRNREVQPELFCGIKKKQKRSVFHKNIFEDHYKSTFSLSCDTLIVIVIALVMVNLASYVIGVERGKILAKAVPASEALQKKSKTLVKEQLVTDTVIPAVVNETEEAPIEERTPEEDVTPEPPTVSSGYVIQLVTYSSDSCANREVESLRAQGYNSHVVKSGDYFVVYSGIYESKSTAKEKLVRFKERYKDCFVRLK